MDMITDEMSGPNGICFSPDYKKVYIADTVGREIRVFDIDGKKARNGKRFVVLDIPGTGEPSAADGMRVDVDGNLWCGARPGVQIVTPNGERIGFIRLAGDVRQHLLRRSETEPAVHGRELVAVYGVRGNARRAHRVGRFWYAGEKSWHAASNSAWPRRRRYAFPRTNS